MSKVDPITNKVLRREDGKILKGINYSPPDFSPYLQYFSSPKSEFDQESEFDPGLFRQVITRMYETLKKDNNKNEN
jgi:hypothetical protein